MSLLSLSKLFAYLIECCWLILSFKQFQWHDESDILRILSKCLLISSLPGKALRALRTLVDISRLAERCQQAFSKLSLVNLISKDTNLVF